MKNTYLFELKDGNFITTKNTTVQKAYSYLVKNHLVELNQISAVHNVALIDGKYVKFGLDRIHHLK